MVQVEFRDGTGIRLEANEYQYEAQFGYIKIITVSKRIVTIPIEVVKIIGFVEPQNVNKDGAIRSEFRYI